MTRPARSSAARATCVGERLRRRRRGPGRRARTGTSAPLPTSWRMSPKIDASASGSDERDEQRRAVAQRAGAGPCAAMSERGAHVSPAARLPVRCRNTASRSGSSTSTERTATPAVGCRAQQRGQQACARRRRCSSTAPSADARRRARPGSARQRARRPARSPVASSRRGRARRPARRARARVPSAISSPWSMIPIRSQRRSASSM